MQQILKPSMLGRVSVLLAIFFFIFSLKEFVEEWSGVCFPQFYEDGWSEKRERLDAKKEGYEVIFVF